MKYLLVFIVALSLTSCASEFSCKLQSEAFVHQTTMMLDEWEYQNKVAGRTSRMLLPAQIDKLRSIRTTADRMYEPDCAQPAKKHLVQSMDYTIDAYLAFLGQDNDKMRQNVILASQELAYFRMELAKLQ